METVESKNVVVCQRFFDFSLFGSLCKSRGIYVENPRKSTEKHGKSGGFCKIFFVSLTDLSLWTNTAALSVEKSRGVVHSRLWRYSLLFLYTQVCGVLVHKGRVNQYMKKLGYFEKIRSFSEILDVYTKSDRKVCGNRVVIHTVFHNLWKNPWIIHRAPRNYGDYWWEIMWFSTRAGIRAP